MRKEPVIKEKATLNFHTDERDMLRYLVNKYKCSPFTGECYTQEVSLQKVGKTYHIILSEQQMSEFSKDDFIVEEDKGIGKHRLLLMIKPTLEDNNYIFFRKK